MKSFIAVILIVSAVKAGKVCDPDSFFTMDCNVCTCASTGEVFACTDMMCPKEDPNNHVEKFCIPESTFSPDQCNTCRCNKDGTSATCTMINCSDKPTALKKQTQVCQPKSQFKDYCNSCFCSDDGLSFACTKMDCNEELWNEDGSLKFVKKSSSLVKSADKVCEPNTQFKDDCNVCMCSNDGLSKACTMIACDDNRQVKALSTAMLTGNEFVCSPNSQFKEYCNTCLCSEDGLDKFCTMMNCDKYLFNENGSLKFSPSERKNLKAAKSLICTPNAHFKEYCNTCVCSEDGLSKICTKMACDENIFNEDGSIKVNKANKFCEPGKSYSPDGCNTCFCNKDGTNAMCTIELCLTPKKWGPLYSQGEECTPGLNFYSECNQCICAANGREAVCTQMLC